MTKTRTLWSSDLSCDNGLVFEAVWSRTAQSVTGHALGEGIVGAATSLWLATPNGERYAPIWERPDKGLAAVTVWCWWPADTPTGALGVDVIFQAPTR